MGIRKYYRKGRNYELVLLENYFGNRFDVVDRERVRETIGKLVRKYVEGEHEL